MTMGRRWLQRFQEMTLRGKLVAAFAVWGVLVLGVAAGYLAVRFEALLTVLGPSHATHIRGILGEMVWLVLGLLLATVVVGVSVSRSILRPLSALARAVRDVKPGASHLPLPPVLTREGDLWELTQAFDHMAHALGERDAQLQQTLRDRERQIAELAAMSRFAEGCAQFRDGAGLYQHLTSQMAQAVDA